MMFVFVLFYIQFVPSFSRPLLTQSFNMSKPLINFRSTPSLLLSSHQCCTSLLLFSLYQTGSLQNYSVETSSQECEFCVPRVADVVARLTTARMVQGSAPHLPPALGLQLRTEPRRREG